MNNVFMKKPGSIELLVKELKIAFRLVSIPDLGRLNATLKICVFNCTVKVEDPTPMLFI